MKTTEIESFRQALAAQRRSLLQEVSHVEADLGEIAEQREIELEETAQEQRTARILAQLDNRAKAELEGIERALERIASGEYGTCEACGEKISLARLRALPATPHCRDCAERAEHGQPTAAEGEAPKPARSLPPDYGLLSGRELEAAIFEHLRDDGHVDMDELRIVCHHGVIYLDGCVPSEREHQILRQTITDIMGLNEIVDRLQITEILWERESREKPEEEAEVRPWEESAGTEDVTEIQEDGRDFAAPVRPLPEEE